MVPRIVIPCFLLLATACSPALPPHPDSSQNTITVSGEAHVFSQPDTVIVNLGIETFGPRLKDALSRSNQRAKDIIAGIQEQGVEKKNIQTSFNVYPQYQSAQNGQPAAISGYTVSHQLTVKVTDVEKIDAVLSQALEAGANTVGGIQWTLDEKEEALSKAREAAVADARRKAQELAKAADVGLGPVVQIQEGSTTDNPRPMALKAMAMESDQSVPVEAGQVELRSQVTVQFRIQN